MEDIKSRFNFGYIRDLSKPLDEAWAMPQTGNLTSDDMERIGKQTTNFVRVFYPNDEYYDNLCRELMDSYQWFAGLEYSIVEKIPYKFGEFLERPVRIRILLPFFRHNLSNDRPVEIYSDKPLSDPDNVLPKLVEGLSDKIKSYREERLASA